MSGWDDFSKDGLLSLYKKMRLARDFDLRATELQSTGKVYGAVHQVNGQEAVSIGVCAALADADIVFVSHRGHAPMLAKGMDPGRLLAEMGGKRTGFCKGKAGSMHIVCHEVGLYGACGIVGGHIPHAVGVALAAKIRGTGQVVVPFFGDGASNQGVFHESLNMASIWKLPVVFVCENNQYACSVRASYTVAGQRVAKRGQAYDMPGIAVDGMDVIAVYEAAKEAVERARSGKGPSLLECETYRYAGHFSGESPAMTYRYRDEEEINRWKQRDPLRKFATQLVEREVATDMEIKNVNDAVEREIEAAVRFLEESPFPETEEAFQDMYAVAYPGIPVRG